MSGRTLFGAEEITLTQHILLGLEKTVVMAKIPEPGTCVEYRCEDVRFGDQSLGH